MALTVTPYTLPNLHRLSLDNIPLDNLALVYLARRRDIELCLTRCQVFIDTTPVSAFELRIVPLTRILYTISTSSRHLRHLRLGSQLLNLIDRRLPIKFDSLHILQLEGPPEYTSRIFPSILSNFHGDWVLLTI